MHTRRIGVLSMTLSFTVSLQGQLGHSVVSGDMALSPLLIPRHMFGGERIAMVSCGDAHTAATSSCGSVFV